MALTKIGATLGGSADVITVTQSSHGLYLGYPVKMTNSGYAHATADTAANAEAVGIVIATDRTGANTTFSLALGGRVTVDGCVPNLATGTVLFLQVSAGLLAAAEPSGNTQVSKPMAVITIANSEMIMVQQRGEVISTAGVTLADGSVDNDAMADNAIDTDEIAADAVTNAKLANMAANTVKVNATTSSANPTDISMASANLSGAIADDDVLLLYDASTTSVKTVAKSVLVAGLGGIASVLADTTPQLGGNLDMQARLLVGNGGSTGIAISSAGEVTMAAQPGFLAYKSGTTSNIVGQSGLVTMGFNQPIFDQNDDYDDTDTFTAPVTGRYLIVTTLYVGGVTAAANVAAMNIYTTNRTYNFNYGDPIPDANGEYGFQQTAIVDMDATNTVYIALRAYGESSNVWDIQGSASAGTSFSAWLLG